MTGLNLPERKWSIPWGTPPLAFSSSASSGSRTCVLTSSGPGKLTSYALADLVSSPIPCLPKDWSHCHVSLGNSIWILILRTMAFPSLKIRDFSSRLASISQFSQHSEPAKLVFVLEFSREKRPRPRQSKSAILILTSQDFAGT